MEQIILLESLCPKRESGMSFVVSTTGQQVPVETVLKAGYCNGIGPEQHALKTGWKPAWFLVRPNDKITVFEKSSRRNHTTTFVVTKNGLPDPPQKIQDHRTGTGIVNYLAQYCQVVV